MVSPGPYFYVGQARGKDVFVSKYALRKAATRKIKINDILDTISRPWKRLIDMGHKSITPGFKRIVYVSLKHSLIVVTEEDTNIIVVTSWSTSKNIRRLVENRIKRGVWVET